MKKVSAPLENFTNYPIIIHRKQLLVPSRIQLCDCNICDVEMAITKFDQETARKIHQVVLGILERFRSLKKNLSYEEYKAWQEIRQS